MKLRRFIKISALLVVVIVGLATGIIAFAPGVFTRFLPASLRNVPAERIVHELVWRLQFLVAKSTGDVPSLSWAEVAQGVWPGRQLKKTWPGSGFLTDAMVSEGRSLDAAVLNPLDGPDDIARGKKIFQANCAACHGNDGRGGGHAPSLAKANYSVGSSDLALYKVLRDGIPNTAMAPRGLSVEERWQVVGFLRSLSKTSADKKDAADTIPPIDVSWGALLKARSRVDEWLTYSGSLNGWRHSPLRQITPKNVAHLKLIWAHQFAVTGDDSFEATPIITGKTIFLTKPPSNVVALNATTGREIWNFDRSLPAKLPVCCGRVNRGLAISGDTLFVGTLDANLIALDARTGEVKWKTRVANPKDGFTITVAPLVVKNSVVIGISGGEFGTRGFLDAYDVRTGKKLWRFYTIPGPGEPGHDTWKTDAWKTGGGPTWVTGSYDADLNLLYWGVGNPAPNYAGDIRPGDNPYTNSVIALNATTGKLVWHFQFTPHDEHDWDANQTPVLADLEIDGSRRKVMLWANRNGFYYVIDRTNGEFLRGVPFVEVNWATGLDGKGRPIETEAARVTTTGMLTKPWVGGGTNWPPPSFDPATKTFFVHATEGSSIYTKSPAEDLRRGEGGLYVGSGQSIAEEAVNIVKALDATTGAIKWEHASPRQQPKPDQTYSGVLSTAAGLVFSAYAGVVFAMDSATGKELWRAGLGGKTQAPPISFMLDGKQVIAITGGKTFFLFGL